MIKTSTRTIAPTLLGVPLEQFRDHLRITGESQDTRLRQILETAIDKIENMTGRCLVEQTWELSIDTNGEQFAYDLLGTSWIQLPKSPLSVLTPITSFKYYLDTGASVDFSDYWIDTSRARLVLNATATWPVEMRTIRSMVIVYKAGYTTTDVARIPAALRHAVMLLGAHLYSNPEAVLTGSISKEFEWSIRDIVTTYSTELSL